MKKIYKIGIVSTLLIAMQPCIINAKEVVQKTQITGENSYQISKTISQKGWQKCESIIILNEKSIIDGIITTPLASLYDSPILLSSENTLPNETKSEIERLKPKKIILIGGENTIASEVVSDIKSISEDISIERIGGNNRYETSLEIAKHIDEKKDVNKIYVGNSYGEPDLISIATKAGQDKQPIILSEKDKIKDDMYELLKSEELDNAYIIGGENSIQQDVIESLNKITLYDISKNRIGGVDRYDTNVQIIDKFYNDKNMDNLIVTDSKDSINALMAAPLSSKIKSPIMILPSEKLTQSQVDLLNNKYANKINVLGNNVNSNVLNELVDLLTLDNIDYSNKDVIFFIPHQDDEVLSFSNTIKKYIDNGSNVRVVLHANGSLSFARHVLNGEDGRVCRIHNYVHSPRYEEYALGTDNVDFIHNEELSKYRDDEFKRSLSKLGVKEENIYFSQYMVDDRRLNKKTAIRGINEFMEKYPNAIVHTFYDGKYSNGNHIDHMGLGEGARELYNKGIIKQLYMHVEPYLYEDLVKRGLDKNVYEYLPINDSQDKSVKDALKEYCKWDPKTGKLAIGYHSVSSYFDEAIKNPVNYIMKVKL